MEYFPFLTNRFFVGSNGIHIASFIGILFFTSLLLSSSLSFAQSPDLKDQVFNPDKPQEPEGEMISLVTETGITFKAYEVIPKQETQSAVLLIHEWWGLDNHIKSLADQYALLGHHALAVDLFDGKVTENPDEASRFISAVKLAETLSQCVASVEYLSLRFPKVAVIGWSFGGGWAIKTSLERPELVSGTIIYYGELVNEPAVLAKLKGPVLGIFARKDEWITTALVEAFKTALEQANVPHEIYSYEADHAFANPSDKHFNEPAYRDAWEKTMDFLRRYLEE